MQSSLNEATALGAIVDVINTANDVASEVGKRSRKSSNKDDRYLGGSISRYTKKLTMSFPVLCDNTLSVQTMQLVSKANEKNIVSMLQQMFTSMSLDGKSGVDIISTLHTNMNQDIDDIIDQLNNIANYSEGVDPSYDRKLNAECRDIIKEMVAELKKPQKSFPTESLNEKSLNGYQVRNDMYGNMHVIAVNEYRTKSDETRQKEAERKTNNAADSDTIKSQDFEDVLRKRRQEERDIEKANKDEERAEKEEQRKAEKRAEERQKDENINRRAGKQDLRDRDMANQAMGRQILDSDFKKANELQPTLMVVNFNDVEKTDNGNIVVVDRKSFICGVKCRLIGVDGMDIVERLVSKKKSSLSFKNFIKATTGETSLIKDFFLAMNQQKLNAKNAAKKGISAQMWNLLEKRANKNNMNKARRSGNDASCITTLVVNAETASYLTSAFKFDINVPKNAKFIMDSYNLLGLFIADEANEVVKVMYDGNPDFEMVSYQALSKEYNDASSYKKTVNLINQMGR